MISTCLVSKGAVCLFCLLHKAPCLLSWVALHQIPVSRHGWTWPLHALGSAPSRTLCWGPEFSTALSGGFLVQILAFKLASASVHRFNFQTGAWKPLLFSTTHWPCNYGHTNYRKSDAWERDHDIVMVLMRVWRSDIIDHAVVEMCQLVEIFLYCMYSGRFPKIGRLDH